MQVQALFQVNDVLERKDAEDQGMGRVVKLNAAYENNPEHPNYHFWKATPTGSMEMQINNPSAFGFFRPGKKYLLTFEEVE
jgi:hypothetical protein